MKKLDTDKVVVTCFVTILLIVVVYLAVDSFSNTGYDNDDNDGPATVKVTVVSNNDGTTYTCTLYDLGENYTKTFELESGQSITYTFTFDVDSSLHSQFRCTYHNDSNAGRVNELFDVSKGETEEITLQIP